MRSSSKHPERNLHRTHTDSFPETFKSSCFAFLAADIFKYFTHFNLSLRVLLLKKTVGSAFSIGFVTVYSQKFVKGFPLVYLIAYLCGLFFLQFLYFVKGKFRYIGNFFN